MRKVIALLIILSLLMMPVLACNGGGGNDDDNNGDDRGTTPPDDGAGTTPGTTPGTGNNGGTTPGTIPAAGGTSVGQGHVVTSDQAQESGGFFGYTIPGGSVGKYCNFWLQLRDTNASNDIRAKYQLEVIAWNDDKYTPKQFEKRYSINNTVCGLPEEISFRQIPPPNVTTEMSRTAIAPTQKQKPKESGFPLAEFIAIFGGLFAVGYLVLRQRK